MDGLDPRERESILRDLRSSDEEVRRLAVERAGMLSSEEAEALLMDRLGDESWRVRKAAIERLGHGAGHEAALIEALSDGENSGRRNAALEALVRRGVAAVPALLEATTSPDLDVRKQVVDALAGIADASAADRLRELLRDRDANVRGAAADALGSVGLPDAVPELLEAAHEDGEALVRLSALRALLAMQISLPAESLAPMLHDPHLRAAALELLGFSDDEASLELLLKGLQASSRAAWEAAIRALLRRVGNAAPAELEALVQRIRAAVEASPPLLPAVFDRMGEAPLPARLSLVQFLGLLPRRDVVLPLLDAASDEALEEVVVAALQGLGEPCERVLIETFERLGLEQRRLACRVLAGGSQAAGEARLLGVLACREGELRAAASEALAARHCLAALEPLVRNLAVVADDDYARGEREVLVEALCRLADEPSSAAQLAELLFRDLPRAGEGHRRCAAQILGRTGVADEERIRRLLSDPSESVRRAALEGLRRRSEAPLGESLYLALADESAAVRGAAALLVARDSKAHALEGLRTLACDEDPRVRAAALDALALRLGQLEDDEAAEATRRLAREMTAAGLDDRPPVAIAAARALSELGGVAARRLAVAQLQHEVPEVVEAAVACIERHGEEPQLEALLPLLGHATWSVRAQAVQALAARGFEPATPAILRRLELEDDDFVREAILRALRALEA